VSKPANTWGPKAAKQTAGVKGGGSSFELPEECADVRAFIGWDGLYVGGDEVCVVDMVRRYFTAVQESSCIKCVPCRVGTRVILEVLNKFDEGLATRADLEKLNQAAKEFSGISLCGLGSTAIRPLADALERFADEFEAQVEGAASCASHHVYGETLTGPCQNSCPAGVRIPDFIGLMADGKTDEAAAVFKTTNPFPAIVGRVCPHPCQDSCTRNSIDEPISVAWLHRYVGDHAIAMRQRGIVPVEAAAGGGERVAVVGAGPAGLTVAYYLAKYGHEVTILEALPAVGGMLRVGIPEYRLPNDVIDAEVDFVRDLGVEIQCNIRVGSDVSVEKLQRDYKAVFLGVGAHQGKKLGVPGEEEYEGVEDAVTYLRRVGLGNRAKAGDKVCVIGGGNSAIDSARTSLRLGSSEVSIVYRRGREQMPANVWEIEEAEHEGVNFHYLAAPTKILGANGRVTGMECVKMELGEPDASGRRRPVPVDGSEFVIECDVIVAAVSQEPDLSLLEGSEIETTRWNTIVTDPWTMATNVPGVFAGGDAVSGPLTVVSAIGQGRRAALAIRKYLNREKVEDEVGAMMHSLVKSAFEADGTTDVSGYTPQPAAAMPSIDVKQRRQGFSEVETGYPAPVASYESNRCLRCYRLLAAAHSKQVSGAGGKR